MIYDFGTDMEQSNNKKKKKPTFKDNVCGLKVILFYFFNLLFALFFDDDRNMFLPPTVSQTSVKVRRRMINM